MRDRYEPLTPTATPPPRMCTPGWVECKWLRPCDRHYGLEPNRHPQNEGGRVREVVPLKISGTPPPVESGGMMAKIHLPPSERGIRRPTSWLDRNYRGLMLLGMGLELFLLGVLVVLEWVRR